MCTLFSSLVFRRSICRIRGRAVKALRSGRSHLWWRGFESHRMQHLFGCFITSKQAAKKTCPYPTARSLFLICGLGIRIGKKHRSHARYTKKSYGGTGIRARVERITTANANHYTIPPQRYRTTGPSSQDSSAYGSGTEVLDAYNCFDSSVGRALD